MSSQTKRFLREALRTTPPPVEARFFYTSPIPIDDPLSPLPPLTTGNVSGKQAPKPFSKYDNAALDKAWHVLRRKILDYNNQRSLQAEGKDSSRSRAGSASSENDRTATFAQSKPIKLGRSSLSTVNGAPGSETSLDWPSLGPEVSSLPDTTGTPFVRAPSRGKLATQRDESLARPTIKSHDTYEWDDTTHLVDHSPGLEDDPSAKDRDRPTMKVAVGVSRLHQVEMPDLKMSPIYWTPVGDIAEVVRGTWFYQDTMYPVETAVANMLEAGYVDLQVWSETWIDELNSAVEVGASGEMKIVHKLWPDSMPRTSISRPNSGRGGSASSERDTLLQTAISNLAVDGEPETAEQTREKAARMASDLIDISTGPGGVDNKASGISTYGRQGALRTYASVGVIYANEREARLLKPSLLPSAYFGRRPLANYIRKGYKLGIPVVRGFDQAAWDKLHPPPAGPIVAMAQKGAAVSASGVSPSARRKVDLGPSDAERPQVTDLILVIHGIGQQYSKRLESFHFTHAMNAFRRDVNVEVANKEVKARFRRNMGEIMVLPVNWRHALAFDEDIPGNPVDNEFSLADITAESLPSIRHVINDVMIDIPLYLSHHQPRMIAAVVQEANRVYQLWCLNNPGFAESGRVHLIAHSLGSVMAVDILSRQPTTIPMHLQDPRSINLDNEQLDHFLFNTSNLYLAGSPTGFFLLLKKAQLLPRIDHPSADAFDDPTVNSLSVCGERGQYGCVAVDNIYNIINPYDPVAYRMNATVDKTYSASLKQAVIPSATPGWFGVGAKSTTLFGGSTPGRKTSQMPTLPHLPSNVELEVHNFTREEIAEKRMLLLNDNGQIDYFLRYGGGTFEIQYITMLGAHSSYWLLKDFVRMIVTETGRETGRDGTFLGMRAAKKKTPVA